MEEKRFVKPEADVVVFSFEDIITSSGDNPWVIGGTDDDETP